LPKQILISYDQYGFIKSKKSIATFDIKNARGIFSINVKYTAHCMKNKIRKA
jgi:hypothetical protein